MKAVRLCVLLLVILPFAGSVSAEDECNIYPYVTPTYVPGFGMVCAGWGMNCTECVNVEAHKYCVKAGNNPCPPDLDFYPGG